MDNYQIQTAQNVTINQNLANLGERCLAYFIDYLILVAYGILSYLLMSYSGIGFDYMWAYVAIIGLPVFLYHLLLETFNNGQSLGKMAANIKVVKLDGSAPRFSDFLIRWLLRIIDFSLTSGGLAIFCFLLNKKGQRLGDMAARTTVISERKRVSAQQLIYSNVPDTYEVKYPEVSLLDDKQMQEIGRIFKMAEKNRQDQVLEALSKKTAQIIGVTPSEDPISFLKQVIKDYQYFTQG
ncbi:RDD family protein [Mesonia sediminis]|uniref:RDD family protein n=1 Tax=Mesonia sediminis TaxID=1703946 RepID=A0ABW5SEH6_9FLAO